MQIVAIVQFVSNPYPGNPVWADIIGKYYAIGVHNAYRRRVLKHHVKELYHVIIPDGRRWSNKTFDRIVGKTSLEDYLKYAHKRGFKVIELQEDASE
jgi:hypothetical protein